MPCLEIGYFGERLDLKIRQGATFGPISASMLNPDGTPVDLTGCTLTAKIRRRALDVAVVKTIPVTITDAANGEYEFGLTDDETAAITAGERIHDQSSKYVWAMDLVDSAGRTIPLYYGQVIALRRSTQT